MHTYIYMNTHKYIYIFIYIIYPFIRRRPDIYMAPLIKKPNDFYKY